MSARNLQREFLASADPERTLLDHLAALVGQSGPGEFPWRPGSPLRLLLAGYSGAGNVGTEMRTGEIRRQLSYLLGAGAVEFSALSLGWTLPADTLVGVHCVPLATGYIPEVVANTTRQHHATIACEGSMFKSTFANILSAIMAGALGMASRGGNLAVGYGAEVATMDSALDHFVRQQARDALIICRNEPSLRAALDLGLRAGPGTDTAWTFEAAPRQRGAALLRSAGWNGVDKLLVVCPMNPFWWPVRPSPQMARELRRNGAHKQRHFASLFFHAQSPEIDRRYRRYVEQLGFAVGELSRSLSAWPVMLAMDRVDTSAARDLAAMLSSTAVIVGAEHRAGDVVAALRCADLLISSRFHALVGAMPSGVPSIGIAMDERIANLLTGSGQAERLVAADDPDLGQHIVQAARRLDRDDVSQASRRIVGEAIQASGEMGRQFLREVRRLLPDFALPDRPATWQAHVSPLPDEVDAFLSAASA